MTGAERREFVRIHRTAVFGYSRRGAGPSMSIIYYVMDGDELLVSTMAARGKAKAVAREPNVSLCVLDEKWPPVYLLVYGTARIETDFENTVDLLMRVSGLMAGTPMPESARPSLARMGRDENRVVLRVTPVSTFESPPRHVYKADDVKNLTHGLGTTLPWSAP